MKNLSLGSKATLWVAVVAGLFAGTLPCFASQDFERGVSLYSKGQYQAAADAFVDAACAEPKNYAPHYALGSTYMNLGKSGLAVTEYELCLEMYPDAKTKELCKVALRTLSGSVPTKADSAEQAGRSKLSQSLADVGHKRVELQAQAAERQKNQITHAAQEYAVRVKENAKLKIEQLKENSSWFGFDLAGERVGILPYGVEESVTNAANAQAERAIEKAHEKVKAINPSGASDVTDGLRSQLYSNSGVRLKPLGTNVYVRNYESSGKSVATSGASLK